MTTRATLMGAFLIAAAAASVLILSYVGTAMVGRTLDGPADRAASVGQAVRPEPTGEAFPEPLSADWEATVMGALEGGQAYAMMRADGSMFYAFFEDVPEAFLSGTYHLRGAWLGTTCAYRRSVFGTCVPEVRIDSVEPVVASGSVDIDE